ncbi:MAG TPA: DUF1353 domain-containing protein [Allosphingosinicella sp.]|uniref:DUF1353 domain-containing protein n=1 Tax=Allosphingosinicella sp. TaxID=2823234 RepID=UPI002ED9597C
MAAQFSGEPKTIWLTEGGADRRMKLVEDFWFDDRTGTRWHAKQGSVVDGASIPRALWVLVGSPYTGEYRRASIVHDIACVEAEGDDAARKRADKMFYQACRAGGCNWWDATILYIGVRIGAWYGGGLVEEPEGPKLRRTSLDEQLERDFQMVSQIVLSKGETDDPEEIEARTDEAAAKVAKMNLMAFESGAALAAA